MPAGFRTDSPVNIDLSVPIWTIEHVAAAFRLLAGFSRNLWTPEAVLDWVAGLAPKPRGLRHGHRQHRHRRPHGHRRPHHHRPADTRPASAPAQGPARVREAQLLPPLRA